MQDPPSSGSFLQPLVSGPAVKDKWNDYKLGKVNLGYVILCWVRLVYDRLCYFML